MKFLLATGTICLAGDGWFCLEAPPARATGDSGQPGKFTESLKNYGEISTNPERRAVGSNFLRFSDHCDQEN